MKLTAAVRLGVDNGDAELWSPEVFFRTRDPAWRRGGRLEPRGKAGRNPGCRFGVARPKGAFAGLSFGRGTRTMTDGRRRGESWRVG